jgi:threonyl-tRNA synthetase
LDNEKIGYKIREATIGKVHYLVIIGDKEIQEDKVSIRKRNGESIGPYTTDELVALLKDEIELRR